MKTKLLRRVRRRYSIEYREKSDFYESVLYGLWDIMFLWDNTEEYRRIPVFIGKKPPSSDLFFETKEEAFEYLRNRLCEWIARDYKHAGVRRNKTINKIEKLWWK
jgi:hypothetical protein